MEPLHGESFTLLQHRRYSTYSNTETVVGGIRFLGKDGAEQQSAILVSIADAKSPRRSCNNDWTRAKFLAFCRSLSTSGEVEVEVRSKCPIEDVEVRYMVGITSWESLKPWEHNSLCQFPSSNSMTSPTFFFECLF